MSNPNIFGRGSSTQAGYQYGSQNTSYQSGGFTNSTYNSPSYGNTNTSYGNNTQGNYGGYGNNSHQRLGSYRVSQYDPGRVSSSLSSLCPNWKDYTPMSITLREETLQLHPVEQRLEDYFLIRKRNLESKHQRNMDTCIDKGCFNRALLDPQTTDKLSLFPYSNDPPLNLDQLKNYRGYSGSSYTGGYSGAGGYSGGGGYSGTSGTGYSGSGGGYSGSGGGYSGGYSGAGGYSGSSGGYGGGNYNNNYGGSSSYGNNNNPFTGGGSSSNQNPFMNRSTSNNTNPFGNNNRPSTSYGGSYGNNSYGNNSYGNNSYGNNNNPFNNNSSTYNTRSNSNPFGNNSQNTGGNPFNNNNNSGGNPFMNNSQSAGNNPFNNNSRNMNTSGYGNRMGSTSYNLFNNGTNMGGNPFSNQSRGNNPFSNNNTGNPFNNNSGNPFGGGGNNLFGGGGGGAGNNLFNSRGGGNSGWMGSSMGPQFYMMQMYSMMQSLVNNNSTQKQQQTSQAKHPKQYVSGFNEFNDDNWSRSHCETSPQKQKVIYVHIQNQNRPQSRNTNLFASSPTNRSNLFKQTRSFGEDESSAKDMDMHPFRKEVPLHYRVEIKWKESLMESVEVQGKIMIEGDIAHGEIERKVLDDVLKKELWVRRDAEIALHSKAGTDRKGFHINGEILHRKINVNKNYDYTPHVFEGFEVKGLTILNQFGRIEWPQTINVKNVDFSKAVEIHRSFSAIQSEQLEKYLMLITINSFPKPVKNKLSNPQQAKQELEKIIGKDAENIVLEKFDPELQYFTFKIVPQN